MSTTYTEANSVNVRTNAAVSVNPDLYTTTIADASEGVMEIEGTLDELEVVANSMLATVAACRTTYRPTVPEGDWD